MPRSTRLFLWSLLAVFPVGTQAGSTAGFCPGATPLPADAFETSQGQSDDDSRANAGFIEFPSLAARSRTFHDDLDEDWFRFQARESGDFPNSYRPRAFNFGTGIALTDTGGDPAPDEGTGIRIEVFDSTGSIVIDPFTSEPVDTGSACGDGGEEFMEFVVPADGVYFIRVSQCRNTVGGNEGACIPDNASYDFALELGPGLNPGLLSGTVTDAATGQPVLFAEILSTDLNNFTFSLPGYGAVPDGSYMLSDTVDRSNLDPVTATISREPDYLPATVQFTLDPGLVTQCNVALTPNEVFADGFEANGTGKGPRVGPKGNLCSEL